mmetsp:Transcript_34227/g.74089  ORF Transcript_34227/g.74089 Transcript_34227/m.74089 type:complete len:552 (+) Transcript_34227:130-1785(+)
MNILPLRRTIERIRLGVRPFNVYRRGVGSRLSQKRRRINQTWVSLLFVLIILSMAIKSQFFPGKTPRETKINTTHYDAVVIGAGWAGLKAAQTMLDYGISSILVLEANGHIGGRAKSINTKGPINSPDLIGNSENLPIEMGCEWLYLDSGNMEMEKTLNIRGMIEPALVINNTKKLDSIDFYEAAYYDQTVNANGIVETNLAENITTLKTTVWDKFNVDAPFNAINSSKEDDLKNYKMRHVLSAYEDHYLNLMRSIIEVEYAGDTTKIASTEHVALASDTHYTSIHGLGFGNIAGKYAESFKSKIKLNANVIEVNYSDERNNIITYVEGGAKKTVSANAVLVTVPLGVLKAKTIDFIPTFPDWKQDIIDNMGVGLLNKCILQWNNPSDVVWPKDKFWLELITPDEASADKWTTFFNPTSFKNVPVLVGFIAGDAAIDAEDQTDDEILEDVMRNLKAMYPSIRKPDTVVITRWGKEPTARGSYAFTKVNRSWGHDKDNLRKRINNLWFAGEATYRTPGSTVAAWKTGETAAKSMASALSEKSAIRYNTPLHG